MSYPRRSTSTVPITCPTCWHEGPAYVYLLGKRFSMQDVRA